MKSINHAIHGLVSSLLLNLGLTRLAEKFDPMLQQSGHAQADAKSTAFCELPCQFAKSSAAFCELPCQFAIQNVIAQVKSTAFCELPCQFAKSSAFCELPCQFTAQPAN